MKERFAESEFLAGVPEKLGGAICMQVTKAVLMQPQIRLKT